VVQWVFVAVGGLWPLIAFAGGLGYSPLITLAAILCLWPGLPKMRLRFYMFALFAALEFMAASARWSPRQIDFFDFDFAKGDFAVRFEVLRVGLGLLGAAVLMSAANTLSPTQARGVVRVMSGALLIQLVVLAILTLFEKQALDVFSSQMSDSGEGIQNISRNGIIMALAAPFLIVGLGRSLPFSRALLVEIAVFAAVTGVLFLRGVNGGIVSVAAGLLAVAVVRIFPRSGFKLLGVIFAGIIMGAPQIFGYLSRGADAVTATDSVDWRLAIWRHVIEVINKDPVFGQGLGVLRTMQEKIPEGVFKDQYYIPNHAHNMALQLWAETGVIGAALVAAAIVLAAFRMPQPRFLGVAGFLAAALAGQFMAIALVSFDLWNDWWWACAGLLGALTVVMARAEAIDDPARMLPAPQRIE
jgi:O-antigen ligase